ncbi:MAG: FHA domain-containing protein [Lachnospiraceae bacterium]|nr:FHA domain-containing protein [Lachnospiraceae bacterium]
MAVIGIVLLYPDQVTWRNLVLIFACILAVLFLLLAVMDKEDRNQYMEQSGYSSLGKDEPIAEIVLLNEEDKPLMSWDIYGKTAMVIGRDVKENQVDIDLGQSPYASMVDIEHAVLNYSAGSWYVEDLGSSNGISVKKVSDGRVYKLSRDTACRLERGDCLYIGLNHLLLK